MRLAARDWPLVGRATELSLTRDTMASGRSVVLAGAPGIGKTRLGLALAESFERDSTSVFRLLVTKSVGSIPFGAFGPLLPALPSIDVLTVNAVVDDLKARFAERRPVLCVDDAHLLDDPGASLLHRLLSEAVAVAVVTVRSAAPAPDAVAALWKDGICERIELQALSAGEVRELCEKTLGYVVDEAVPAKLWAITHGNLLWLRELINAALDDGALIQRRGTWLWARPPPVTPALRGLLASRLSALQPGDLDTLALLTVAEALPLGTLIRMRGVDVVERLAQRELVSTDEDPPIVRIAHPLFGEIVHSNVTPPTHFRLSRELALAHPGTAADPPAEIRRVVWQLDGGVASDPDQLLEASRFAQLYRLDLATRLARAAVAAGGGVVASLRLADLLANAGQLDEAYAVIDGIDDHLLDDRARIRAASLRASTLLWFRSRPAEALHVIEEAEAHLQDPSLARELAATRVQAALQEGRFDEVARLAGLVLDDPEASYEVKAGALLAGVAAWLLTGALGTAIERCESGLEIALGTTNAFPVRDLLHFGATAARLYLGELDRAAAEFRRLRAEQAASDSDVHLRFLFSQGLGRVELLRGRARSAARYFREAAGLVEQAPDLLSWNLGMAAQAHASCGEVAAAEAALVEAEGATSSAMLEPDRARARALISFARGEHSRAARQALVAADRAIDQGQRLPAVFCAHDAARLGLAAEGLGYIERAGAQIPGSLVPALRADAAARAAKDATALVTASVELEQLGCLGYAAEAAATAASWCTAARDDGRAAGLTARFHDLAVRAGERPIGSQLAVATSRLTAREREVAAMAAQGRSDKEIAAALGVSFRTVETHLHRVYAKLGLASRFGLAEVMSTYVIDH